MELAAIPAIAATKGFESFSDAEQRRALGRGSGDGLRGKAQQPGPPPSSRGGGVIGVLEQLAQVGVQQVGVVGEQIIDQSAGVRVTG